MPDDFAGLVRRWRGDAIEILFGYVWRGFDSLLSDPQLKFDEDAENIERGITQCVCQRIRDAMQGKPPFYLEHHPFEDESRATAPAAPPAPDLAFVFRANPRATLPLEAKVLHTDGSVGDYVREIMANFLECRYAPFSSEGGMLGYLLKGVPSRALKNIAVSLDCELVSHPAFADRDHACSHHERMVADHPHAPPYFTCHHLIILFGKTS